jgi:hypothetical protein
MIVQYSNQSRSIDLIDSQSICPMSTWKIEPHCLPGCFHPNVVQAGRRCLAGSALMASCVIVVCSRYRRRGVCTFPDLRARDR